MPKNILKRQFDGKGSDGGGCEKPSAFLLYRDKYLNEFKDLIMNSVAIENLSFAEENFAKTQLFSKGFVGYNQAADSFLWSIPKTAILQEGRFWKSGQFYNAKNVPIGVHDYDFESDNEFAWRLFVATPSKTVLFDEAEAAANDLADCDIGIMQNIRAVRTPNFWATDSSDFVLSVKSAVQDTEAGASHVIIKKDITTGLNTLKNETPFIADKIQEQKKIIRNEFLTRLGILTANSSKRERVQSLEVEAGIGEAVDLIYTVVDYWNKQVKQYGLNKYKMKFNGVSEEYFAPTKQGHKNDENDNEQDS